jgi:signal transduction histidine kinase
MEAERAKAATDGVDEQLAGQILRCLNRGSTGGNLVREVIKLVKKASGFDAVAIRQREGDDFPYLEVDGFDEDFVAAENYLCCRDEAGQPVYDSQGRPVVECMCGSILRGRTDATLPFFTEGGSFWTNSTTELLALTSPEDLGVPTRNQCNRAGYESVALIPLRSGNEIVGLLQLNDTRRGRFTPGMVRSFEEIGESIGIGMARIRAEEDLIKYRDRLEELVQVRTAELTYANEKLLQEIEGRKRLEKEILNISEREQRRIGRELHDSIGQQFTGIAFMMKVLEQKLTNSRQTDEATDIAEIKKLVNQAMDQTRGLAKGLHPIDLDAGSLVAALQELAATTERMFGVRCALVDDGPAEIDDPEVATHLYRITQEAITNAIKHGKAKDIRIKLACKLNENILTIENDGLAFPEETEAQGTGMGLQIMDHRADIIGASLNIRKGPKDGTIVTCSFQDRAG